MGWILVAVVGVIVVLMAIYSTLKVASDCDDQSYGDSQYDEN